MEGLRKSDDPIFDIYKQPGHATIQFILGNFLDTFSSTDEILPLPRTDTPMRGT
jgi:hypothetical protein